MKQLRILTGTHAGARLDLVPGRYRLGVDSDADLQVTDWPGGAARLVVGENGAIGVEHPLGRVTEQAEIVWFMDYVPIAFESVVLCVGDHDAPWPDDVALMASLYVNPKAAAAARRRRLVGVTLACIMVGSLVVGGGVLMLPAQTAAADMGDANAQQQALQRMMVESHLDNLKVVKQGASTVVVGLVMNSAEDMHARELIGRLHSGRVDRAYDVADNDVHGIEEALGIPGARVRYAGRGVFEVGGVVRSRDELDAAIAKVRKDLDANVADLRPAGDLKLADSLPGAFSEVMLTDGISYGQTPDGVKHLYNAVEPH